MDQRLPRVGQILARWGHQIPFWATAAIVATAGLVLVASCSPQHGSPQLIVDESVASDFQALAEEAWVEFLVVFQARTDCFGDVHLRAARTLDSRAAYDPDTATVTVRVPGTPALLQGALVHEWAHHVEFQCKEHEELRPAFLAALGLPEDTPWRPDAAAVETGAGWGGDIPSEQYAEATIVLVLGRRQITTGIPVTQEAVRTVEAWAAGD
jgi:hypothetical protein